MTVVDVLPAMKERHSYAFQVSEWARSVIETLDGHDPTASHVEIQKMTKHRIYTVSFASVYPHYVAKAEKKGRTKAEVDEIIRWLTGYSRQELDAELELQTDFETFFSNAPRLNPARDLIQGVVCGVRVEDIEEPTMREIRYLDKLIDELARGKAMEKILRE